MLSFRFPIYILPFTPSTPFLSILTRTNTNCQSETSIDTEQQHNTIHTNNTKSNMSGSDRDDYLYMRRVDPWRRQIATWASQVEPYQRTFDGFDNSFRQNQQYIQSQGTYSMLSKSQYPAELTSYRPIPGGQLDGSSRPSF